MIQLASRFCSVSSVNLASMCLFSVGMLPFANYLCLHLHDYWEKPVRPHIIGHVGPPPNPLPPMSMQVRFLFVSNFSQGL